MPMAGMLTTMKRAAYAGQLSRRLLQHLGLSLFEIAAIGLLAFCTSDLQAGAITDLDLAAAPNEMSHSAGFIGQESPAQSPVFDLPPQLDELWRLLVCAGRDCGSGAGAPATTTLLGKTLGGGAIGPARAEFQLRLLRSWFVAEEANSPPPLMLISRPFHPPRRNG